MPRPAHARITFSGVYGSTTVPNEIWAFGVNLPASTWSGDLTAVQAKVAAFRNAYATNIAPMMGTDVILTRTRFADVDDTGHVVKNAVGGYRQEDSTTFSAGTYSTVARDPMPLQTALCISLTTARSGPEGKGRFFLPWPKNYALSSDYRLTTGNADSIAAAAKAFLNAIASAAGAAPVVVSSKGYTSTVTGVRVGLAPDTMRSRRGALLEGYRSLAL